MNQSKLQSFLFKNISSLEGVGVKISKLLKKKKIEKVSDILWNLPQSFTDRTNIKALNNLQIGKITTIKVKSIKYNFPRIRNLPSKVTCEDSTGKIDIIFFNSREGYIRKVLPLNSFVIISGKVKIFKKKYQITNPTYVVPHEKESYVNKVIPKYSLTDGITEKIYRKIIDQVLFNVKELKEWHTDEFLKRVGNVSWSQSLSKLHCIGQSDLNSKYYRRLAYDEILSNFLVLSRVRKKIKKIKKKNKSFDNNYSIKIIEGLKFSLTESQIRIIKEINSDLKSDFKMFRLLQGDVGSGKTIISLITAANVIRSKWQVAFMAPTEILAKQHYELAKKIFKSTEISIAFLSGKIDPKDKKIIQKNILNGKINLVIGTHALFQKKTLFKNLGFIIIDEQHKFGVRQRIELSNKGGKDCDLLLMSATPIPRTLVLSAYGDMDISRLNEKPFNRKEVLTLRKPEEKINEILFFIKKEIKKKIKYFGCVP